MFFVCLCFYILCIRFIVIFFFFQAEDGIRDYKVTGVQTCALPILLFSNRWLVLAGWIHYLAFDLFVGSWEVRDARERGIPHLAVVPCLLLTFMFGPAGWLAYSGVRIAYQPRGARPGALHD